MESEKQTIDYKSIQKIRTGDKGFRSLAESYVAFANAQGGRIFIGYDDKTKQPLPNQVIEQAEVNNAITKLRSLCFNVSLVASATMEDESGSQYFIINISPSLRTIEPHTLKALIIEDLRQHPKSSIASISSRLPDVMFNELRKMVYSMVGKELVAEGGRTYRVYTNKPMA
ncbi:hypothetical protein BN938_1579 [Mucinivorans hirudinis]|uniref:Schlafen AlbA-2 domain-containing protein n=1 Tax=Mucinivorans hirudinis TaxID=1433126 RepID=A0A060R889_9BACT|nr:hypothetical protein BN938_1579 [Mucinivorans hirudinis]